MKNTEFRNVLLTALVVLLSTSCHTEGTFQIKNTEIDCEIIDTSFLWPSRMSILDDKLIYIDTKDNNFLHIYSLSKRSEIFEDFIIGAGPNELLGPFSIEKSKNNKSFWIHDIVKNWFQEYNILEDSIEVGKRITFNGIRIMRPIFLNDSTIIGINFSDPEKGWISKIDLTGNYKNNFSELPTNKDKLPPNVFSESYQGKIISNSTRTIFVLGTRYADILKFFNKKGQLINQYRTLYSFDPIMKVSSVNNRPVMGQDENTKIGFTDICSNDVNVFALYSGKSRKEKDPSYGNNILVFDWFGNLLKVLKCKYPIGEIEWSDNDTSLYLLLLKKNHKTLAKIRFNET